MISHKHRCLFIHIPKCAGTSNEHALGYFDGAESEFGGQDHRTMRTLEEAGFSLNMFNSRENMSELARRWRSKRTAHRHSNKNIRLTPEQYRDYFKFTVVRSPWTRVFSVYKYSLKGDPGKVFKGTVLPRDNSFKSFVDVYLGHGLLRSQMHWLKDFNGGLPYDFICKFENLNEDFKVACIKMGIEPVELPHKLQSQTADYHEHYNDELIERVGEFYSEEVNRFDYCYE